MSDSMDKFVLQYQVEMKDAITRLEQLSEKVKSTNKEAKSLSEEFKGFVKKGAEDLQRMVPGLSKVSSQFSSMKGGIIAATVALVAMAAVMRAINREREQYALQRETGFKVGTQPLNVELNQQRMSKASGGAIKGDEVRSSMEAIATFQRSMFEDYTKLGRENIIGRKMGVKDTDENGNMKSFEQMQSDIGKSMAKMTEEQAQGYGQLIGLSANYVAALRKTATETDEKIDVTYREAERTKAAQDAMDSMTKSINGMGESMRKTGNEIANVFLPVVAKVFEWVHKGISFLPDIITGVSNTASELIDVTKGLADTVYDAVKDGKGEKDIVARMHKGAAEVAKRAADKNEKTGDDFAKEQKSTNQQARQTAAQVNKDINMFSAAVATFARAIDEQQAWAAWAGDLGRASGIKGASSGSVTNGVTGTPGSRQMGTTPYDSIFDSASKKYGVDANLLKQITNVESKFNPKAQSEAGAVGLMQLMPEIAAKYGIKDRTDPSENINGGARLMAELLKRSGGNVEEALSMYHGGLDRSKWGAKTAAYAGKVLGSGTGTPYVSTGIGQSKESMSKRFVMENIASALGVPLGQLQTGGVNKGDVDWARSQIEAGLNNNIIKQSAELNNPFLTRAAKAKIISDINANATGLASMVKFGGAASDIAREGDRSITIGERAIQVIVNGAQSPKATAEAVHGALKDNINDIIYGSTTSLKY